MGVSCVVAGGGVDKCVSAADMPCLQSTTLAHAAMTALSWLKRGRLVSAVSRSTGDLLKALQQQNGAHHLHHQSENYHRKGSNEGGRIGVIRTGYLYVLTDAGFWFRMWVVLRVGRLETFYESSDSIPMETVSLGGGQLVIPRAISSECPEDILYPMHVYKEGQASICLAAESADEQRRWAEALRASLQASSLDMEGLNLEGHGGRLSIGESRNPDLGEDARGRVFKKLDLLDELLTQRDVMHAPNDPKVKELCQKLEGVDQWYERVLISEQAEALRRATHLRQRKISTQLKADTIREQLRSFRKSRPKMATLSFRESPRRKDLQDPPSAFYEGQLRELTDQLNLIHSSLGREEAHSETASRKLVRKHDHEIHRLHSDLDLLHRKVQGSHPRIQVSRSQEDCRMEPRLRNTGHDRTARDKNAASMMELSRPSTSPASKSRLSPLRLLGQLVDARRRRVGERRNASEELLPQSSRGDSEELASMEEEEAASYQRSKRSSDSSNSSSTSSEKLRTEIDPSALAEIQAFELLTEQALASARPSRCPSVAE